MSDTVSMGDTVSGAVIVSSLGSDGPTFLFLPDVTDNAAALHVPGGAYAEPTSFGLIVDFRTLSPDLQTITPNADPTELPASVSGYAALLPDDTSPNVAGAMFQS
jgi:hypothetical protein